MRRPALVAATAESLYRVRGNNLVSNSTWSGAAVGSPGTLPTGMSDGFNNGGTMARSVIAITSTQLGRPAIDIRIAGTPTASSNWYMAIQTSIPAQISTVFSCGIVVSVVGGTTTNINNVYIGFDEVTSGNAYITSSPGGAVFPTSRPALITATNPVVSATAAKVQITTGIVWAASAATDITIRFSSPLFVSGPMGY